MKLTVDERIERTRQAIMRLRELLDIMSAQVEEGEVLYRQLFAQCTPEEVATLKEKDLQLYAACHQFEDPSPIGDAALHMAFIARNLERDFHQIHDNMMAE